MNNNFRSYNLSSDILKALDALNYHTPTMIQHLSLAQCFNNQNQVIKAQTGSGKTLAYGIPVLEKMDWHHKEIQTLVLCPTRELAIQVSNDFYNIGFYKRLKALPIYGKESFNKQVLSLKQRNHSVVATPGRLIDHIEHDTINLSKVKYLIIDEADELFNTGFKDTIINIIESLPKDIQIILVYATRNKEVDLIINDYIKNYIYLESVELETIDSLIDQEYLQVVEDKNQVILDLIKHNPINSGIIFCNTKKMVDSVYQFLKDHKVSIIKLHGDIYQKQRINILNEFMQGHYEYIICSNVLARGIDIEKVDIVYNYDTPLNLETYQHRIGRTGRALNSGKAITLAYKPEMKYLNPIIDKLNIKEIKYPIPINKDHNITKVIKKPKGYLLKEESIKLYLKAGKKQKLRSGDIVGSILSIEGLSFEDIGIINIDTLSSSVEILNNKGQYVLEHLSTKTIKGKIRKISIMKKG